MVKVAFNALDEIKAKEFLLQSMEMLSKMLEPFKLLVMTLRMIWKLLTLFASTNIVNFFLLADLNHVFTNQCSHSSTRFSILTTCMGSRMSQMLSIGANSFDVEKLYSSIQPVLSANYITAIGDGSKILLHIVTYILGWRGISWNNYVTAYTHLGI